MSRAEAAAAGLFDGFELWAADRRVDVDLFVVDAASDSRVAAEGDPAMFWTTRVLEHGVDPDDAEDVRRFVAAARAGDIDYDRDVLAEIMRRQAFDAELDLADVEPDDEESPWPPVDLPSDRELATFGAGHRPGGPVPGAGDARAVAGPLHRR